MTALWRVGAGVYNHIMTATGASGENAQRQTRMCASEVSVPGFMTGLSRCGSLPSACWTERTRARERCVEDRKQMARFGFVSPVCHLPPAQLENNNWPLFTAIIKAVRRKGKQSPGSSTTVPLSHVANLADWASEMHKGGIVEQDQGSEVRWPHILTGAALGMG